MRTPMLATMIAAVTHAAPVVAGDPVWRFHPIELPKLDYPGNIFTSPMAINDAGEVTGESGSSQVSIGLHAFMWSPGSTMIDLDGGQWSATAGLAINQSGLMTGDATFCPAQNGACGSQPLVIQPDGTIIELEPAWVGYLVIMDINENGVTIFNRAIDEDSFYNLPRQWTPGEDVQVLPIPGTSYTGYAMDQNDADVVAGYSLGGGYRPHIWTDGTMTNLQVEPGGDGRALSINNAGVSVGMASFNGVDHAVRWDHAQASPERLIEDPAVLRSKATQVLEDGTVIGTWDNSANLQLAFRIAPDGTVDLYAPPDSPGGTLDVTPIAATLDGWVLCSHMNDFYQVQSVIRIPGEGWVYPNDRLVGPGSATSELPMDMNASGQIITRGAAWTTPLFLDPMPPGDVNGDKVVGVDDLLGVLESYGLCNPDPSRLCPGDITADGLVNVDDILGVINRWP